MKAQLTVNGFDVRSSFDDKNVNQLLVPLLHRLTQMQAERDGRLIVFLAAPPGAGKSTLAAFMEWLAARTPGVAPLQAVGMDGFHYPNAYLDTHTFAEDGREVRMRSRKGAPQTFDVDGLRTALADARLAALPQPWPAYSRILHDPVPASLPINEKILLVEGNYLLLDQGRWSGLAELADFTVFLAAPEELLRERLVARKIAGGTSPEDALAWYEASDGRNVACVLAHHRPADLELELQPDGLLAVR